MHERVRLGIDVGGTFTDAALVTESGHLVTAKVPTTGDQSRGVLQGVRKVCRLAELSPDTIDEFTHSMTVSVNALLEETGARTALLTTRGFRDVLEIGRQNRPDLYDLNADKPSPLVPRDRRLEVDERATVDGITKPADPEELEALAEQLRAMDVESVAICFLHAYAHPDNEAVAAEILRENLDAHISVSHEVLAEFREYERTSTTVIDAYLTPEIDAYLKQLEQRAGTAGVPVPRIMQANGGIAPLSTIRRRAITTVMSGPAAGVVGARATLERAEPGSRATADTPTASGSIDGIITFDMGGTSSDVSLIRNGEIARTTDTQINGRPIKTPMVDVNTVGAGGGSIAWVDAGGALRVGPRSAGAEPGPACYGKGGQKPTVTDANLLLGYIGTTSRLGGELTLDASAARRVVGRLTDEAGLSDEVETARGIYEIANAAMTRAIRSVTVERGYDPRGYALAAFGGAGPMHAAALAEALDIDRIIVPRACGVLSAFGLLAADEKSDAVQTIRTPLQDVQLEPVEHRLEALRKSATSGVSTEHEATVSFAADVRYSGQSFEITVPFDPPLRTGLLAEAFHREHERSYGYRLDEPIELVNLRATASIDGRTPTIQFRGGTGTPIDEREAFFDNRFLPTPVYMWDDLHTDQNIAGPMIVEQNESTVIIPPAWSGQVLRDGTLALTRD